MEAKSLHAWNVTPKEARDIQNRLRPLVIREGAPQGVRRIAAVDISVDRWKPLARGAVVVFSYPELDPLEQVVVEDEPPFPYVPGLLSFREAPILLRAFQQIREPPDLLLVDGQGYAHPRRIGIACHLGLLLDMPAIGCAKSRLCGEHAAPGETAGSQSPLMDGDEIIGRVVRTRDGVSPVYVSVGHRIGLDKAVEWVLRCCRGYRLPEPLRAAHTTAGGHVWLAKKRRPSAEAKI